MTQAYEIIEHGYDVVIVGAGGAGLRAALGMRRPGLQMLSDSADRGEAKREPGAPARRIRRIGRCGRTAALIVALGSLAILGACAGEHAAQSGSTTTAGEKADAVGGGGRLDEIYREIYTPGNPKWSDF